MICSDIGSFDITPVDGTNGIVPVGTTYTWTVDDASNVITGEDAGTGSSISDSDLFNTTSSPADLVYTVTPSTAEGCVGEDFTITITVNPEPQIDPISEVICSDIGSFDITPVDGTNGIVPVGTTYTWTVDDASNVITGEDAGTGSSISDSDLFNTTSSPADLVYTVTPSTAEGCVGEDFTITITVNPEPQINDVAQTICNDETFTTVDPQDGTNGIVPVGTTYSWGVPVSNPAGAITGGVAGTDESSIVGTQLTNGTSSPADLVYTVTPSTAEGCVGEDFTITITVNPEPQIDPISEVICSDIGSFDITPVDGTNGIVPVGTTYTWTVDDASNVITGEDAGTGSSISDSDLFNTTSSPADLVYTVTPSTAEGCVGEDFTITITVNPEPQIDPISEVICSDIGSFDITPVDGTNGIVPVGTTYTWTVDDASNVITGEDAGTGSSISDSDLFNTQQSPADLVYTVTPSTAEGCVGEDFTITITVNPEPQINDVAQTICNDETFTTVDPQDGTNGIVPVGTTYSWGVPVSNPAGAITGGVAGTDESSIVGTQLTNGTSSPADLVYTVTHLQQKVVLAKTLRLPLR